MREDKIAAAVNASSMPDKDKETTIRAAVYVVEARRVALVALRAINDLPTVPRWTEGRAVESEKQLRTAARDLYDIADDSAREFCREFDIEYGDLFGRAAGVMDRA